MPTSYYATVQLSCDARVVDDPAEKAAILSRQLSHFEPAGGYVEPDPAHEHFRRRLPGIRGLVLTVTGGAGEVQVRRQQGAGAPRAAGRRLAERDGPADARARDHLLRRHRASEPAAGRWLVGRVSRR